MQKYKQKTTPLYSKYDKKEKPKNIIFNYKEIKTQKP